MQNPAKKLKCHLSRSGGQCGSDTVQCAGHKHVFCREHAYARLGEPVVDHQEATTLHNACPVCFNVCCCTECCEARKEHREHFVSYVEQIYVRRAQCSCERNSDKSNESRRVAPTFQSSPQEVKNYFASTLEGPLVVDALSLTETEFNELYERVVLRDRRPIVLSSFHRKLDRDKWNLPDVVLQQSRSGNTTDENGLMNLRLQMVRDDDWGAYRIEQELNKVHPLQFLQLALSNGNCGDAFASRDSLHGGLPFFRKRDGPCGQKVFYCKDWMFDSYYPPWGAEFKQQLPDRLRPSNDHDLIGGLMGATEIKMFMAYVGTGGTRTPLHCDKVASVAFNCVVWAETADSVKYWWLFHPDDHETINRQLATLAHSVKNSKIQDDSHWVNPCTWQHLELKHKPVFFAQRLGDLIVVPPSAPHYVLNGGGVTFAVAANVIDTAVAEESFRMDASNRSLKIPSVYKVRRAIWDTLKRQTRRKNVEKQVIQAAECVLAEESVQFSAGEALAKADDKLRQEAMEFVYHTVCDGCHADIFNSYVEVKIGPAQQQQLCVEPCYNSYSLKSSREGIFVCFQTLEELQNDLKEAKLHVKE